MASSGPLSFWLLKHGFKGKPGDPVTTIANADEAAVVRHVLNLVEESKNHKLRHWTNVWLRNLYFTYGAQHIRQDDRGRWHPRPLTEDERHVTNLMLPRAFRLVSQRVGAKPTWAVVPMNAIPEEVERARTSEKMLRAYFHSHEVLPKRILLSTSEVIYGSAIAKVYYDKKGGAMREQVTPELDAMGNPTGREVTKWGPQGKLILRPTSLFDFHVPQSARSPLVNDCNWLAEQVPESLDVIWERFKIEVSPDAITSDPLRTMASDFTRFLEASDIGFADERPREQAFVTEYHELGKDIPGFERGIRLLIAGQRIVGVKPQQLPPEEGYPYVHFVGKPRDETFWGHSDLSEMISSQQIVNKDRRILHLCRDLTGIPLMWDPFGSGLAEMDFTTGPRVLTGAQKPEAVEVPQMSQALIQDQATAEMDLDKVSNQFGPARGEMPGKSPFSADALQFLKESQEAGQQVEKLWTVYAYSELGQKVLQLMKSHMTEPEIFVLQGPAGLNETFQAGPKEIPERFRAMVQEDTAFHELKVPMEQKVLQGLQAGIYGQEIAQDPLQLHALRSYMQFPTPRELVPPEDLDRRKAVMEAALLLERQVPPEMGPLENKAVHLTEHIKRTKQPDYVKWPQEARGVFEEHIQITQKMLMAEQSAAQRQQFQQGMMQAAIEASSRGKFREAEALLVVTRGILEQLQATSREGDEVREEDARQAALETR